MRSWLYNWQTFQVLLSREVLRMLHQPSRVIGVIFQPLLFWVVLGSGFVPSFCLTENPTLSFQEFFFPGVLALVVLFSAIFSTITLIEDRASGFMQTVLVGPGSRFSVVLGKVAGVVCISLLQATLFLFVAPLAGISLENIELMRLLIVLLFGAVSMAGLGFVFAWVTDSSAAYHALMSIILIPMWVLSGAVFPPAASWSQTAVLFNPMGWFVAALRAVLNAGHAPLGSVPLFLSLNTSLILMIAFSFIILLIGVYVCHSRR